MKKMIELTMLLFVIVLTGCVESKTSLSGKACLGINNLALVEYLDGQCKDGDIVATKRPAYYCDFNYSVAYNSYNSATCVYNGKLREERIK